MYPFITGFNSIKGSQFSDKFTSFFVLSFQAKEYLALVEFCNATVRRFRKCLENMHGNFYDVDHF